MQLKEIIADLAGVVGGKADNDFGGQAALGGKGNRKRASKRKAFAAPAQAQHRAIGNKHLAALTEREAE